MLPSPHKATQEAPQELTQESTQEATRLLLVRHGETDWNRQTRIQGHTDISLNDLGLAQAQALRQALANEDIAACYASDLERAMVTAQGVADHHGLTLRIHPGLRERGFGHFEGLRWAEIEEQHPEQALLWRQRDPHFAPPGGETLIALQARVRSTINTIASAHPGEQILVVSHGGILDMLYRLATHLSLDAPRTWQVGNAAINRLLWTPDSGLSLVGWADAAHLPLPTDPA